MASGSGYQHLQKYKGSLYGNLNYSGIEYDYEVPDNIVVSSPGGVSGIHHHYTKGIYSDESSTQDIHAGNGYADAYPYGEYGNMYQVGQSATRYMGDFVEPADLNGTTGYTQNQGEPRKEYFKYMDVPSNSGSSPGLPRRTGPGGHPGGHGGFVMSDQGSGNDMELISPDRPMTGENRPGPGPSTETITPISEMTDDGREYKTISLVNVLKIMAVFTVGYLAVNFWVKGGEDYIATRFYEGGPLDWKQYILMALIFTGVLLVFAYAFGIPLVTLEKI